MKKYSKLHKNYSIDTDNKSRKRIYSMPGYPTRPHPRLLYAGGDSEPDSLTDSQVADLQAQYDEIDRQQALENEAIALDVEQQIRNTARQIAEQRASVLEPAPIPPPPHVFPTTPQNSPPGSPVIGSPGFSSQHRLNQAGIATSPEISQSQKRKMSTQPGEDEECQICLQNLAGLETKQCKKQCGKFMCKDCWRGNLRHGVAERRNDCPMCRQVDAFSQSQLSQQTLPSLQIEAAQPLDGSFDYDFYDSPSPILVTGAANSAEESRPESPYRPFRAINVTFSPAAAAAAAAPAVTAPNAPNAPIRPNQTRNLSTTGRAAVRRRPTRQELLRAECERKEDIQQ